MDFVHSHNKHIDLVDRALPTLNHQYGIQHLIYIELFNNKDQALMLSNVPGLVEKVHTLGKFSDDFYQSIQRAEVNLTRTFLWPANPRDEVGLTLKEHGLSNGMTIIQKHSESIKTWAYLGDNNDTNLSDLFINEKRLFYDFIPLFQEKVINNVILAPNDYIPFKCSKSIPPHIHSHQYDQLTSYKAARYYLYGKYSDVYITGREKICMSLLACGKTYKEIALDMTISSHTVKKHIDSVKLKTGILRKSMLVDTLIKMGVVTSG